MTEDFKPLQLTVPSPNMADIRHIASLHGQFRVHRPFLCPHTDDHCLKEQFLRLCPLPPDQVSVWKDRNDDDDDTCWKLIPDSGQLVIIPPTEAFESFDLLEWLHRCIELFSAPASTSNLCLSGSVLYQSEDTGVFTGAIVILNNDCRSFTLEEMHDRFLAPFSFSTSPIIRVFDRLHSVPSPQLRLVPARNGSR